jgi:hypothetical protein
MNGVVVKEGRLPIGMDDLDFGIIDVIFEAKVLNRYNTFDQIVNRTMEDVGDVYLHCDLLDRVVLTTFTLRVTSPHIEMYEHLLQKGTYVRMIFLAWNQNPSRVLRTLICILSLLLSRQPLCHQFQVSILNWF